MKSGHLRPMFVVALTLAFVASSCSSTPDEEPSAAAGADSSIVEGSSGSESDAENGSQTDSGTESETGTAPDETASDNEPSASGPVPMSAAEAIELHGPLEQAWTGPLTEELVCAEFPLEHVLAVLGLTEDRVELDGSFDCEFRVDGQDYAAILTVSVINEEQAWVNLKDATVPVDARLPLNVADEGVASNGDRPWAAVRDRTIGWKIVTGGVNSDDVFTIDTVLMAEFMTILTTRFSAATQQSDEPQESAEGDTAGEPATSDDGASELPTRDELEEELAQFAPLFGWTEADIACLADELTALTATNPSFLDDEQYVSVYQQCGVLDSALIVAASTYLTDGDGQCLVDALSDDELLDLASAALIEATDAESEAAFDAVMADHPECLN